MRYIEILRRVTIGAANAPSQKEVGKSPQGSNDIKLEKLGDTFNSNYCYAENIRKFNTLNL